MKVTIRCLLLASLSVGLSGCFELEFRGDVQADGSVTSHLGVALEKAASETIARMLPGGGDFATQCKSGFSELASLAGDADEEDEEDDASSKQNGPKQAAGVSPEPAPAKPAKPAITGTFSLRDKFAVCTFSETVKDPVADFKQWSRKSEVPANAEFEKLPSGDGYRVSYEFRPADLMGEGGSHIPPEHRAMLPMLMMGLSPDLALKLSLTGVRIENTDGKVSADGRTVTWTLPLRDLLDMRTDGPPKSFKAEVYFR